MAQWDMRSLALYISEVQEAGQWDLLLGSCPYVRSTHTSPLLCCSFFSFLLLSLSCRFFVGPAIILFGAYSLWSRA
jgi:hypothetical protein